MSAPSLSRHVFKTSRLAEFCSEKELINQTGHDSDDWPPVVLKELIDNALDACEEAEVAPEISVIATFSTKPFLPNFISSDLNGPSPALGTKRKVSEPRLITS